MATRRRSGRCAPQPRGRRLKAFDRDLFPRAADSERAGSIRSGGDRSAPRRRTGSGAAIGGFSYSVDRLCIVQPCHLRTRRGNSGGRGISPGSGHTHRPVPMVGPYRTGRHLPPVVAALRPWTACRAALGHPSCCRNRARLPAPFSAALPHRASCRRHPARRQDGTEYPDCPAHCQKPAEGTSFRRARRPSAP